MRCCRPLSNPVSRQNNHHNRIDRIGSLIILVRNMVSDSPRLQDRIRALRSAAALASKLVVAHGDNPFLVSGQWPRRDGFTTCGDRDILEETRDEDLIAPLSVSQGREPAPWISRLTAERAPSGAAAGACRVPDRLCLDLNGVCPRPPALSFLR